MLAIIFIPKETKAGGPIKFNPCKCYTYYSDGTVMESHSCDAPSPTGACPKIVYCVPPLPDNEQ